ncbi:M20/M25/M40 family metallo-hydrolase [Mucilaginibacter sp. UR6-1]|uniref:M20/M25/M40 family metallo-hydrolase n=1 Tax=Mucilaginibacter sp. UR6-1 TaxID=1435643 RepID=UPI001E38F781|nr:M20/M25/M40 family metallo-hydrolase [Mucilaginibacter sp. UR6-1]MCC8407955.1 M20/M25/M40 family metallo-hydrolase [Mucilaginibacter sp. UR6-1]
MRSLITKVLCGTLCCTATATSVLAQNEPDTAVFNRIKAAELNSSQIPQIAHYLTDVSGPRLANSQGYKRAANWAVSTMKKWGLVNAGLEEWGEFGKQWDIDDFSITMRVPYAAPLRAYPNPWSANTKGVQQGQVIILSPQQYMDTNYVAKHATEFKGKWVLIAGNPPKNDGKFKPAAARLADTALANMKDTYMVKREEIESFSKYISIYKKLDKLIEDGGGLGLITAGRANADGAVFVQAFSGNRVTDPEGIPQLTMAVEDGQRIKRLIASGHPVEIAVNIKTITSTADTRGYNVIAEIPGTDPKLKSEVVMLGGHLDSWQAATGATDNAAGCIVMMEAVRLLDSLGLKPKRTIRIALWDGEEEGLYGSYNYVQKHFMDAAKFKAKPEQSKISAYFNLDNGTGKIRGIFAQSNKEVAPIFAQWFKPFNSLGASTVTLSNAGSTDHLSFDWAGIPAFQFIQDEIDYETRTHHSNLDDYDHLQIDDLKQAAIIVASFVYQTSVRTQMLPRKPLKKEIFVFDGL